MLDALISTILTLLIIPCISYVLNEVVKCIAKILSNIFGTKIAYVILNFITFVGTIHHELSHALFAFITGAKIVKINAFKPSGDTLGNVVFTPRGNKIMQAIQMTLSTIAPIITGICSIYLLYSKVLTICTKPYQLFIIYYLIFSILLHMSMSKQDIKCAMKGLSICTVIIYLVYLVSGFSLISFIKG
jgi:hypothetical protein